MEVSQPAIKVFKVFKVFAYKNVPTRRREDVNAKLPSKEASNHHLLCVYSAIIPVLYYPHVNPMLQ